jgi:hypothetical protein
VLRLLLSSVLRRLLKLVEPAPIFAAPTESQLADNVTHVCYEMAAMLRAAELAATGGRFRFEAFWIHARLLREFLWARSDGRGPGAEHSLLAEHYVADFSAWRGIRGGLPPALGRTKDRVDQQVAHLSRDRHGEFMDLEAEVPRVRDELLAQWMRFEGALAPRWASSFAAGLTTRKAELATTHY